MCIDYKVGSDRIVANEGISEHFLEIQPAAIETTAAMRGTEIWDSTCRQ